MRGIAGVLVAAACGCNSVFGLVPTDYEPVLNRPDADPRADIDRDDIKDVVDPCIAPETDGLYDVDSDMILNGVDPCPLDAGANGPADDDGDGIPNACDPFPLPGDRQRCLMTFTDPDLDVDMWRPRDTMQLWFLYFPRYIAGSRGSIVADWPFDNGGTTTYDVSGILYAGITGSFTMFARAAPTPDGADVGCEITVTPTTWHIAVVPTGTPSQILDVAAAYNAPFRMQLTVEPTSSGTNVRCSVRSATASTVALMATSTVTIPPGYVGFDTSVGVTLYAIAVYERGDAPPL